ncbi:MAG: response regulator transcription factor [Anaerolineales bacterium]|nr:response regulator transcription factor [Anaerolineales bacterium]
MAKKILVVDDNPDICTMLKEYLTEEGFDVSTAPNGQKALYIAREEKPDCIVLDMMMPEMGGQEFIRIFTAESDIPILVLTAKVGETDKVLGLELGADDYVTKPFGLHELRARITAVLRRSQKNGVPLKPTVPDQFYLGSIVVDRKNYRLERDGQHIRLTPRELKLLEAFFCRPNQVIDRNELLNTAWGIDYFGTTRTLDQHIAQLRKKIESDPANPKIILTVHGIGYRLGE